MPHGLYDGHDEPLFSTESFRNARKDQGNHSHDRSLVGPDEGEVRNGSSKYISRQLRRPHATSDLSPLGGNEGYGKDSGGGLATQDWDHQNTRIAPDGIQSTKEMPNDLNSPSTSGPEDNRMKVVSKESQRENNTVEKSSSDSDRVELNGGKGVLRLSPAKLFELASSPKLSAIPAFVGGPSDVHSANSIQSPPKSELQSIAEPLEQNTTQDFDERSQSRKRSGSSTARVIPRKNTSLRSPTPILMKDNSTMEMPPSASRTVSTPLLRRARSNSKPGGATHGSIAQPKPSKSVPTPLNLDVKTSTLKPHRADETLPSPMPPSIPLPPLSIPTYLHLELSSQRPSPLYIHRSAASDIPYESSRVKIERLMNFLLLPPQLELVLWFGALACLDAWLYTFTILPLRFFKGLYILSMSWVKNIVMEARSIGAFVYAGMGRMWRRRQRKPCPPPPDNTTESTSEVDGLEIQKTFSSNSIPLSPQFQFPQSSESPDAMHAHSEPSRKRHHNTGQKHRKSKSAPSALMPNDKADILKGLLILISCAILMYFDASMMYHSIRGQAAIKLYVIYNVLEV